MPVDIGPNLGQFPAAVNHVTNGEYGNETVLSRPTIELEYRTIALLNFVNNLEQSLTANQNKSHSNEQRIQALEDDTTPSDYAAHAIDDSRHTVYASVAEILVGTEDQKVISPLNLKTHLDERRARQYDAIVGPLTIAGNTHETLHDAMQASSDGWKILVTASEFINQTIIVANNNIEVEFRRGASFSEGSATTAFQVDGDDFYLSKARFVGFTTTAINISASTNRTTLRDLRFNGNTANITDLGNATSSTGHIVE